MMRKLSSYATTILCSLWVIYTIPSFAEPEGQKAKAGDEKKEEKDEEKNETCLDCHSDLDNVNGKKNLVVDEKHFKDGPHTEDNGVTCYDCHTKVRKVGDVSDHGKLGKASCDGCHDDVTKKMVGGAHGKSMSGKVLPTCGDCHGKVHQIYALDNKASPVHKLNQPKTCGKCHKDDHLVDTFMKSVHGATLGKKPKDSKHEGPTCSDCHDSHDTQIANVVNNMVYKLRVTKACSKCHEKEAKVYEASVHGQALLKRNGIASASCVDCHLSHQITKVKDPKSNVNRSKVVETCAHCHSDERITKRYHLSATVVSTYESSFHGRARELGDKKIANCSSCHDHHAIFAHKDKRSSVHKDNLPKTCGNKGCHPGASKKFVESKIHSPSGGSEKDNYWAWFVKTLYMWLIGLVIGGMIVHNLVDWIRKNIIRAKKQAEEPHVIRMTKLERILHIMLATSFLSLCYTGFALMYPKAWWVAPMNWISDTEAFRSTAHRIAGVILTIVAIHHVWFLFFHKVGKEQRKEFMPKWNDLRDVFHNIFWLMGKRKERPRFARFSYMEKAEYWALVWGTIVMVVTGFVLWFEEESLQFMPLWLWEVFQIVHRLEAVLAFLAIIVWHFYYVFVNPDESPMSLTWITGRMSMHELAMAHPEEYDKVMAERRKDDKADDEKSADSSDDDKKDDDKKDDDKKDDDKKDDDKKDD